MNDPVTIICAVILFSIALPTLVPPIVRWAQNERQDRRREQRYLEREEAARKVSVRW